MSPYALLRELQRLIACWHGRLPDVPQTAAALLTPPRTTLLTEQY